MNTATPLSSNGTGNSDIFRLSLFYGVYFLVAGVYLPFWPVWLNSRGMTGTDIGLIMAAGVLVKIVSNPLIAQAADRTGERKRIMIWLAVLSTIGFSLFYLTHSFWSILIVSVFVTVTWSASQPLGESLTMLTIRNRGGDYGRIRLWGSLTFIIAAMATGNLLTGRDADLIYWLLLGTIALTIVAYALLPATRGPKATQTHGPYTIRAVLMIPCFGLFLFSAGLILASHAVYYGFGTLHWQQAGYSETVIGWLWAEGVIAEIILFIFSAALLKRLGPVKLLVLGGIAGVIRWTLTGSTDALAVLVIVQALHAFTFGAAHLAAIHYIARTVPTALSATAQSIYSAMVMGLVLGLATMAAGWVFERFGGQAYYIAAAMSAVGTIAGIILIKRFGAAFPEPGEDKQSPPAPA